MIGRLLLATSAASLLFGCDGPHEEAGEKADVRSGASGTVASLRSGPMERAGEERDKREKEQARNH
jgi:hypothetical protein